ncbi:MAG: histidine phosphatase family protein, partial [Dehalococcoidales bacterium]
ARLASEEINAVFSSTLSRARSTAEIIAAGHKVEITACAELCECNFGYVEGLTFKEIERLYPALAVELASWNTVSFPGGESLEQLNDRVKVFLKRLENLKPNDTAVIVSHGGPLRLLVCNLLGIDTTHWQQLRIDRASLSIVETYTQAAIITLLNDMSHLKS